MEKKFYTVVEAAGALGCRDEEVREAIRSGLLRGELVQNIGDYRIRADDLAKYKRFRKTETTKGERFKVLIIDDEVSFANVLKLELERDRRISVRYASWGSDGMRTAREFAPDLCLIDFMLPDVTGDRVLESIRQMREARSTRVLVYSAHTREAIQQFPHLDERLLKLGAAEFMSKSAGLRPFIIKVYELLGAVSTTKEFRRPEGQASRS